MPEPKGDISIDKYIGYPLAQIVAPEFIHPNIITIAELIPLKIAYDAIYENDDIKLFIAIITRTFMDLLDGATARKYNKTSYLGAKLDEISDIIFIIILVIAMGNKNNCNTIFYIIIGTLISLYYVIPQLGIFIHDNTLIMVPLLFFLVKFGAQN